MFDILYYRCYIFIGLNGIDKTRAIGSYFVDKRGISMSEVKTENKMGVMPVPQLVFNMALPMMISMLVQALYNIVDSIFVAKLSEDALTAVSLAFPLQTLIIAVAAGTGVGVNAMLSKALGEKNFKKVNDTACNAIVLYIVSALVFFVLGQTIVKPFYLSQVKTTDSTIYTMGVDYLSLVMTISIGIFMQICFERLLVSTGKTAHAMASQLVGAVTNIILDPIFIFGLLGAPAMGVKGAALATIIGQIASAITSLTLNLKCNHEIKISFKGYKPNWRVIGTIYKVGFPSIIMQSIGSVMTYTMNMILIGFSSTATAVFGSYFKLQSFFFMPLFGMNGAVTPIIAYSYGAQQRKRMIKTIKLSMGVALGLMLFGFTWFEAAPQTLLAMFDASEDMMAIGCPALRIIGIHFLVAWFCIIAGTVFQALGRANYSLVVSVMRQLVVLLPAAYILSKIGGLNAVWWAFPIAEIMSFIVSLTCLIKIYNEIIKPLPEGRD